MKKYTYLIFPLLLFIGCQIEEKQISLGDECIKDLYILTDALIKLQEDDPNSNKYGAIYCEACSDYHTRASEAVLPFAVSYKESGNNKYLASAISTGEWLIKQQQPNGSWYETPSTWTGTTTDQLLMMAASYPLLKSELSVEQQLKWETSIKNASDWIVGNMNHQFASINYCATSTATLMVAYQVIPDSSYLMKADALAMLCASKFDEDLFFTGEGNRIRGTKYGVDLGYSMDMSLWGLAIYSELRGNKLVENLVKESLKRYVYFIYPDGSTDGSWGVRASKWTTYGSVTADGCQILFSLFSENNPVYRNAALLNLNYLMKMRNDKGLLTYGPHFSHVYNEQPCNYPTFCRAKNLAMAIVYGDQTEGELQKIPTQEIGWLKNFKTMDLTLVRTENFMTTITGYRYKDIRRGADFKYMYRPSGGSITNLWVKDYGYLQASNQTEYHIWEMHYPNANNSLSITPRIELEDSNGLYTNLYEFDSHMETSTKENYYEVTAMGELKDRNRWEGGVAYVLTHKIYDDYIEKNVKLRFHGNKTDVKIIEPFVQNENTKFVRVDDKIINIDGGKREFSFELLNDNYQIELGTKEERYVQPFPSLKGYPIIVNVQPDDTSFVKEVSYRIKLK